MPRSQPLEAQPKIEQKAAKRPKAQANRIKLTQRVAERLPVPPSGNITYWDLGLPGFGVRVSPLGRKTWLAMYQVRGGKLVMETLGTMAVISLDAARDLARASLAKARQGINPVAKAREAQAAAEAAAVANAYRLEQLIEDYIRKHHERPTARTGRPSRPSTIYEVRRLGRRALPYLGHLPIRSIAKADILAMVNDLAETRINKWRGNGGSLTEAGCVLRNLSACFRWAIAEDLMDHNPTMGVRDPAGRSIRDRVLSEAELKALWLVAKELAYPFGSVIQLLILTGARRQECANLPWSELDIEQRLWRLPAERSKNHRAHDTHLSDLAMEILQGLPRFAGQDYVFSVRGNHPVSGFSDAKKLIDQKLAVLLPDMKPWVLHDIRRSVASHMAGRQLKILPHVIDRLLNHQGVIHGVAAVYQQYSYADEREVALGAWSNFIERLIGRGGDNVVALAR